MLSADGDDLADFGLLFDLPFAPADVADGDLERPVVGLQFECLWRNPADDVKSVVSTES